jgi:hypothetical protein
VKATMPYSLSSHKQTVVPIIRSQGQRSWPKYLDARPVSYLPLDVALTRPYSTDVHLAAYSMPSMPYRLSSLAIAHPELPDGVCMVLAIFDVDEHEQADIDAWWAAERVKVMALRATHRDLFAYRTRGGYRIIGRLPVPFMLCTGADAARWTQQYLVWVAYLTRAFGIAGDPACKDWTRLYRVPCATREP